MPLILKSNDSILYTSKCCIDFKELTIINWFIASTTTKAYSISKLRMRGPSHLIKWDCPVISNTYMLRKSSMKVWLKSDRLLHS